MDGIVRMREGSTTCLGQANEPFTIVGRVVPHFGDGVWSWTEELFAESYEKAYPRDDLGWDRYADKPNKAIYFYFVKGVCVGQVVLRANWNQYCFIEDIAVVRDYRGQGIARKLLEQARIWALERDLLGFMLETQDVNLLACRFYQRYGLKNSQPLGLCRRTGRSCWVP